MSWKKILADYFTFSRKDRIGIIILLLLVIFIALIPFFFAPSGTPSLLKADSTLLKASIPVPDVKIHTSTSGEHSGNNTYQVRQSKSNEYNKNAIPFPFDPNTLDKEGWASLGLHARTIQTIMNYRSKGGRFYRKEDLKKIWSLPEGFYEHVEAYIRIPGKDAPSYTGFHEKKGTTHSLIDINTADTSAWIALPGIGSKLAARIVNFRDKLGGFHSMEQIGETYGLPDSTFQKIKVFLQISDYPLHTLNINTATKDKLKAHPYIRWNLANAIVEYRNQHGNFNSLEDLKKIDLVDEPTYKKIHPYLTL